MYARFQLSEIDNSVNGFLFLIDLTNQTAEDACTTLLVELHEREIDDYFLSDYLVSVLCDGAAVILGCESGVFKSLLRALSNVLVWLGLSHKLVVSVGDSQKLQE